MEEPRDNYPPVDEVLKNITRAVDLGLVPGSPEGILTAFKILTTPPDKVREVEDLIVKTVQEQSARLSTTN